MTYVERFVDEMGKLLDKLGEPTPRDAIVVAAILMVFGQFIISEYLKNIDKEEGGEQE